MESSFIGKKMKYFTKEWCFSKLDDQEIEQRLKSYRDYIQVVYKKLPFALKLLVQSINLHDGRLQVVTFNPDDKILTIRGVFGDLEVNYFILEMKYLMVSSLDLDSLMYVFKNQELEILSDEIEVLEKKMFSHRILFSTQRDIDIQFQDIELTVKNSHIEDYKKVCCQFKIN
jgi:hypothetical protein